MTWGRWVARLLAAWPALAVCAAAQPSVPSPDLDVFFRRGCPHCAAAKPFVERLQRERTDLRIRVRDVADDQVARDHLMALARAAGIATVGVPAFHVADKLIIGFDESGATEAEVRRLLPPRRTGRGSTTDVTGPPEPSPSIVPAVPSDRAPPTGAHTLTLPLFGEVSAGRMGLPLFSLAVGFVDGINPCAMWALLYLLTLLVPLRDRRKMLVIGATFILVGGLVYFAFLAAWLELFLLIGLSRVVQVVLGSAALTAAAVHVKDFVAFGKGPSLSIPASARPGIYHRARRVITAENLAAALAAVALLSVLVNVVELLCTAGLPAVYTQILTAQELPRWAYYGNLSIYIAAYILDDTIVLAIGVVTLSHRRLQERAGRWLKLVSGLVLGSLGLVLLLRPEWLR